jgi:hypothetical protein
MKTERFFNSFRILLILGLFMFTLTNCNKESEITCNLNASAPAEGVDIEITYKAIATGDGTITSLTYTSSTGNITVTNPELSWTITTLVPANTPISIVATGTVKNGSLEVTYSGNGGNIMGIDNCSQSSN